MISACISLSMSDEIARREALSEVHVAISASTNRPADRATTPISIPKPKTERNPVESGSRQGSASSSLVSLDGPCPHNKYLPHDFSTEPFSPPFSEALCGSCHEKRQAVRASITNAVKNVLFDSSLRSITIPRPTHIGAYPPTDPLGTREHFSDFDKWAASSKGKSIWSKILHDRLAEMSCQRGKLDTKLASERGVLALVRESVLGEGDGSGTSSSGGTGEKNGNEQRRQGAAANELLADVQIVKKIFRDQFPAQDAEKELESIGIRMRLVRDSGLSAALALEKEREAILQRLALALVTDSYLASIRTIFESCYPPSEGVDNADIIAFVEQEVSTLGGTTTSIKLEIARHLCSLLSEEAPREYQVSGMVPEA